MHDHMTPYGNLKLQIVHVTYNTGSTSIINEWLTVCEGSLGTGMPQVSLELGRDTERSEVNS